MKFYIRNILFEKNFNICFKINIIIIIAKIITECIVYIVSTKLPLYIFILIKIFPYCNIY